MQYDVIVIGSGAAASPAAKKCAKKGYKVAIVEKGRFGGTCINIGCNPKKFLYERARLKNESEHIPDVDAIGFDWKRTMSEKKRFIDALTQGSIDFYKNLGIDIFQGTASFRSRNTVSIKLNEKDENVEISAKYFVIAAGAKPRPLNFPGSEHLLTSTDYLEMDALPEQIVFLGGGYISFELAHIARAAGAKVTIVHRDDSPLKRFDRKLVELLMDATKDKGIDIILNKEPKDIQKEGKRFIARCKDFSISADAIFHGAGRVPDIDELDLDQIEIDKLEVDEYLKVKGTDNLYAGGDCIPGPALLPVSDYEGHIISHNLLIDLKKVDEEKIKPDYSVVPSVLFSYPPVATVGKKEGRYCIEGSMDQFVTNMRIGLKNTYAKIFLDEDEIIIGAHIIGKDAGDVVNLFSEFIRNKKSPKDVMGHMDNYPTSTYDVRNILALEKR